ncbi:MAG: peptide deformylase [Pseudomonadales bacterium]
MAILKIAKMGNPCLLEAAKPIADPTAPEIAQLAADMRETLIDIGANGLAAPQVHISKRLIVYRVAAHQIPAESDMKPIDWKVLINPVIAPLTDQQELIWERCLSVPGLHGKVPRYTKIRLQAQQLDGSNIDIEASGFHAMLLQHEYDHLDGYLYTMRMEDMRSLSYDSELGDHGFMVERDPEEFRE